MNTWASFTSHTRHVLVFVSRILTHTMSHEYLHTNFLTAYRLATFSSTATAIDFNTLLAKSHTLKFTPASHTHQIYTQVSHTFKFTPKSHTRQIYTQVSYTSNLHPSLTLKQIYNQGSHTQHISTQVSHTTNLHPSLTYSNFLPSFNIQANSTAN